MNLSIQRATAGAAGPQGPAGEGNVTGPGSSVTDDIATYTDGTGQVIKDSAVAITRVPTQAENDALVGTNGVPSGANAYVTNSDPRNTDARTPAAHTVASHSDTSATGAELDELTDGSTTTLHNHTGGGSDPDTWYNYDADQLLSPNNADWAVNALAPLSADSNNAALLARLFDDTTEEGVGFVVMVPSAVTDMEVKIKSRAETAPAGVRTVGLKLSNRGIPDNGAVQSWTAGTVMTDVSIPTN